MELDSTPDLFGLMVAISNVGRTSDPIACARIPGALTILSMAATPAARPNVTIRSLIRFIDPDHTPSAEARFTASLTMEGKEAPIRDSGSCSFSLHTE